MIEEVRTEELPAVIDTLNQVIDKVNELDDKDIQHELEALPMLSNEVDLADVVEVLNTLITTLRGGIR